MTVPIGLFLVVLLVSAVQSFCLLWASKQIKELRFQLSFSHAHTIALMYAAEIGRRKEQANG